MNEPSLIRRQRDLLEALRRLIADRARAEQDIEARFHQEQARIESHDRQARQSAAVEHEETIRRIEQEYQTIRRQAQAQCQTLLANLQRQRDEARRDARETCSQQCRQARSAYEDARWEATTAYDARKNKPQDEMSRLDTWGKTQLQAIHDLHQQAAGELMRRGLQLQLTELPADDLPDGEPTAVVAEQLDTAQRHLEQLRERLKPGDYLRGPRLLLLLTGMTGLCLIPAGAVQQFQGWQWIAIGAAGGLAITAAAALGLMRYVSRIATHHGQPLGTALATAEAVRQAVLRLRVQKLRQQADELRRHHRLELDELESRYRDQVAAAKARRDQRLREADEAFARGQAEATAQRDAAVAEADQKYPQLLSARLDTYQQQLRTLDTERRTALEANHRLRQEAWDTARRAWQEGMERLRSEVAEIHAEVRAIFPSFLSDVWQQWEPPAEIPQVVRFGEFDVDLRTLSDGWPRDPQMQAATLPDFTLPALVPFPERPSLLYLAADEGRAAAVQSLQAAMLRILTAVPGCKVRFTILDPVGLGENFAAFMHLADYDEALVTSRIWTEPQHIEHRLADLTETMENIIQKYLRNEYQTIAQYNESAGEIAEPYRVLVVANFPANFTDSAVRRLMSILASGARCGVYTLITVDTRQPLPKGITLDDLKQNATVLTYDGQRFTWQDELFGGYPLRLDVPPGGEQVTRILRAAGDAALRAGRVEVPFSHIAPPPEETWSQSSAAGIDAPLGRCGATQFQHLRLGRGTSQHVLVAGKTGSGKSTLWHVLITSLALRYSPDEVELYLIDFKKGVEFKTYASHRLPHARVVSIESDREFGLSVLERLDAELRLRGERFRDAGVQDLRAYREATGETLPRILLIVDEFQELFVEDDKLAQEASLLLDRLVRQGRAFGVHVLLGSQTLGGAYTLARSTLGQMTVRIALQCAEADAHLILSDDNTAARLLSRPGEAIYNDANGLVEGNKPFQVVWLDDEMREHYLDQVQQRSESAGRRGEGMIVFEGNRPAELSHNDRLAQLLRELPAAAPRAAWAPLGEAVAIKDPTAVVFRPQSGSNLLLIGQQPEAAAGILAAVLLSLAAQYPLPGEAADGPAMFTLLDGTPVDSPLAGVLPKLAAMLPQGAEVARWRDLPLTIGKLRDEVRRRNEPDAPERPDLYFFIHDLGRFRDLRREDDFGGFGFGRDDAPPSLPQQLMEILRDGPAVGVHAVLWCDTLNNLNRAFDRSALREFEHRVLFQMSPTDSATLIDTPLAGKLGEHRALYCNEDEGRIEKFRPYRLPDEVWLAEVGGRLNRRPVPEGFGRGA